MYSNIPKKVEKGTTVERRKRKKYHGNNSISTDSLIGIYQSHQELIAHANQRLYFLFGINSALLLSFFFKYDTIINDSEQNTYAFFINGLFFLSFFFVSIALIVILIQIAPKIPSNINNDSLVFFGTLADAKHENFKKLLSSIIIDKNQFVEDIIKQLIILSNILKQKYMWTSIVVILTILSSISIGLMLILTTGH